MSNFLNKNYQTLESYVPGEQPTDMKYIKLNTNEFPYEPSPYVIEKVNEEEVKKLNLYPDPKSTHLKETIAKRYGFNKENVFVSNGSDETLAFYFMAFCEGGVVFPDITYGFYEVYANLYNLDYKKIPLKDDFSIDVNDYIGINKNIIIANPNAPTGMILSIDDIEKIVSSNKNNLVAIDEAYVDFGAQSALSLVNKYDNLIVIQTFSKSRALAGGRLGFAIANEEIILDFEKIKYSTNPYNINRLTQVAGISAIKDDAYYMDLCKEVIKTREYTKCELKKLGFTLTDSYANFVFASRRGFGGEELYLDLKHNGILVRHFKDERVKDYLRITIGKKEDMEALIEALRNIVGE